VVSCGLIARPSDGWTDMTRPQREPRDAETVTEYLFLRKNSEMGEIRLQTSTLMTTKDLLNRVPWRQCGHDEWDFLLRASLLEGVGLAFVAEPLTIWHSDAGTERLSKKGGWRLSFDWLVSVRNLVGHGLMRVFYSPM
jgi:hypothetical protein